MSPKRRLDGQPAGRTSLWHAFGLAANPFFQHEIESSGDLYPPKLFVGRGEDLQRAVHQVEGDISSRIVIVGEPGVGKTSFANRLKAAVADQQVMIHEEPIRLTGRSTLLSFSRDVLTVLLKLHAVHKTRKQAPVWDRIRAIIEGRVGRAGGLQLGGTLPGGAGATIGGNIERGNEAPELAREHLYPEIKDALEDLARDAERAVLIHIDNMEHLSLQDEKRAAQLVLELRDYLLLPHAHWVFVGATGVDKNVFRPHQQVRSIFPSAVKLTPLAGAEVRELLERRYQHLRLDGVPLVSPIRPEDTEVLYRMYYGDLRNFLRLLSDAAGAGLGVHGIRPMTLETIMRAAAPRYEEQLRDELGDDDFEHLAAIFAPSAGAGEAPGRVAPSGMREVRATDIVGRVSASGDLSTAHKIIERLRDKNMLVQSRREGRSVYYRPTGEACVALGLTPART